MKYVSDYYDEVSFGDEGVPPGVGNKGVVIAPPVELSGPSILDFPAPDAGSPESVVVSPSISPASSEASGQGRVGLETLLDGNMMAPPNPAPDTHYKSDDEAFVAEDLRICSSWVLLGLERWRDATRQYRGQAGFVYIIPPLPACLATSLQSLYGDRWEQHFLSPAGERVLFELQAALIGWNGRTFFECHQFLRQMQEWSSAE